GIDFSPTATSTLYVRDTVIRNNLNNPNGGGIFATGTASAQANVFLDNVSLLRNFFGYKALDFTKSQIRNSSAIGNATNGFCGFSGAGNPASLNIENSRSALNAVTGVRSEGAQTKVRITDVAITDNVTLGIQVATGGQVLSFGNNRNAGNGADTPAANGA